MIRYSYFLVFILMFSLFPDTVLADHAEHAHKVKESDLARHKEKSQEPIEVGLNQTVIEVKGVVCSFCAYGIEKKMSKLSFIDTSQFSKGLHTDIDLQRLKVALKQDVPIDFDGLYKSVKDAGYEPIAVHLNLSGKVAKKGKEYTLTHETTSQVFSLIGSSLDNLTLQEKAQIQAHINGDDIPPLISNEPVPVFVDQIQGEI